MTGAITRGRALRGDLALWDGISSTSTRIDASGGTITGVPVGDSVDVLQVYGSGASRTKSSIDQAISAIGTVREATLSFAPGTWTISDNLTIPSNFAAFIPRGCYFDVSSGKTLTFSGPVYSESSAYSSGSGDVVLSVNSIVDGEVWTARTEAEIAAGVTPTNYAIPSHESLGYIHPFRYMSVAMAADIASNAKTLDTTSALNAVWTFAASAGIPTCIPVGACRINSGLSVPRVAGFTLFGWGDKSVLSPSGTFSKAVTIGDTAGQSIRGTYRDFLIDCITGSPVIDYGIYFPRAEEHNFVRVKVWGARIMGISNGYGYVNNYDQCECSYGVGTTGFGAIGIGTNQDYAAGGNNIINISNSMFLNNDGMGVWGRGSYNFNMRGNTIEGNLKAGLYLDGAAASGVRENYFERNGTTGYAFTTPAKTIKADIILVGSGSAATMGSAFPSHGVSVENSHFSNNGGQTCAIWDAGCNDLEVNGCTTNQPTMPLIGEHYNPSYKGFGKIVRGCNDFTTQVTVTDASSAVNNTNAAYFDIFAPGKEFPGRNYALTDFNQWTSVVGGGSAASFSRSTSSSLYRRHGLDVWEISSSASGSSDTFGFAIDSALYPELNGKLVWYGLWCYTGAADPYVVPYCSSQTFNNNPTTVSTWTLVAVSFLWPASGTINFGAFKSGGNTGSVYISAPMLGVVGVPSDELIASIQKGRIWYGTAAPTTGTWERGDIVLRSDATSGGPMGWSCTAAGTPGTWKAQANLA